MTVQHWHRTGRGWEPSTDGEPDPLAGPAMIAWIGEVTGATSLGVERRAAGGSRAGFAVDAVDADGVATPLWLRADTGVGPQSGGLYTLHREAAVYRALQGRGLRIASLVSVHPTEQAFLMGRLEGRNWFSEITDPARAEALARRFMAELARVHAIDVRDLDLPELGPVRRVSEHVVDEIDIWEAQYRDQGEPDPLFELAFAWLRRHLPADDGTDPVLVQGDTGPGNFMYDGDELVAVTDWEMAHLGDLHDDLAWIYVRDLQERFTNLPDRIADYERAGGRQVDPDRLTYFLVLAQTRCAVGTRTGLLARDSRGEIASHLIYSTLHARALAEALTGAMGVTADVEPLADPGPSDRSWLFDVVLDDLRAHVVPAIGEAFAARRAKGSARLVRYLRELDRFGPTTDRLELDDLAGLLGTPVASLGEGRAELCRRLVAGTVDEATAVRALLRREARAVQLLAPAMGALADRHHAPLPPRHADR